MELIGHDKGIANITADELRAYMEAHGEDDYLLIDVRQPEEYQRAHIPGAKLLPLMELERRAHEVGERKEKNKIFYCHSGGRSVRAAALFADGLGAANVFNLLGGITGYNGHKLPDLPKLKAFEGTGSTAEILREAINLEKGAERLYQSLADHFRGTPIHGPIAAAAEAEAAHGRAVYDALRKIGEGELDDFEKLYDELPGDVLEGGATFEQALQAAKAAAEHGTVALLEMALELELKAYDLYRNLAHSSEQPDLRQTFVDLAEQEKGHARALLQTIERAAAE